MHKKTIGILCVQGLPARYGAFEQTTDKLTQLSLSNFSHMTFIVGCINELQNERFYRENVQRIFAKRFSGIGVLVYGFSCFLRMYFMGVRDFLVFGYGLAPFFWLMTLMNCKVVCNVDGFEWRRNKWGPAAKLYFKACEYFAVKSQAILIFDAFGVERYYSIKYNRRGIRIFYGPDIQDDLIENGLEAEFKEHDYFVSVMRMEPENNVLEIVKAKINSSNSKVLLLIGPSTPFFESRVRPLLNTADAYSRVRWLGPIYDKKRLNNIRRYAFAYIHGHTVGGTNPTLVEACNFGRPIIAYRSIFNTEVLGKRASYFSNVEDLKVIFNNANEDLILPPKLGDEYTWEFVVKSYLDVLS